MITVKEFRAALEAVLEYTWEKEEKDFVDRMQDEQDVLNHVFLDIFTIHNALLEADGHCGMPLKHILQAGRTEMPEYYFLCTNSDCGIMNHEVDVIPESLVLSLDEGERIPAGCCKVCGGTVVSL